MNIPRSLSLLAVASLLASCGGPAQPGDYQPEIQAEERELGAEQHPQLLAQFGGAYSASEARYVATLGERLAVAAGLEGQCTFTLVNSDVVNAFAVPGCYIYVTRGLMGIVNSEAELASVLGHELGHIVGDHSERQQKRGIWRELGVLAVGLVTGSERLTEVAARAAGLFSLRYSRRQEYEADDLGIRYLRAIGYDPFAAADMLGALGRHERFMTTTSGRDEARGVPEWARTHPLTENRVERLRGAAAATGLREDALPENEVGYLREVDGLLYGDDPQQGFVLGRRFAHPVMRIGFEAPPGFTLTNSPQAILIDGPDGVRGQFGGGALGPDGLDGYAARVIQQLLGNAPAEVGTAERVNVNGVPAIVVPARVAGRQGSVDLSLAAYAGPGGGAYHFIMVSGPGSAGAEALGALFNSFRLLSPEQVAGLRPRVIRVVPVRLGDTPEVFARRMASDHQLEQFLELNGLAAGQALRPGSAVKIISYL
ncbi:MAG TPA: M48 family metalloprotease [Allosphingosinicella sp.]|jgi:predicted Zn-dependent protease|uniref:M48 family metalloprotease n=1 Tax=Allosphingosinicella sp. TaxID=2823234 RepID=UPI002F2730CA